MILLKLVISCNWYDDIVEEVDTLANLDSNLTVFSVSSDWPCDLNLYVPIPAAVVPIPIIDVLTSISFDSSFSNFILNAPVDIPAVKLPIKLEVNACSESL